MIQTKISLTGILYLAFFLETNIFENHSLFFDFINSIIEHWALSFHSSSAGFVSGHEKEWLGPQPGDYAHYIT